MPRPKLRPTQAKFILGKETYSAFIGGVGSGKTFSGINRLMDIMKQPRPAGVVEAPRGLIGAESKEVIEDIIYPAFEKVMAIRGEKYHLETSRMKAWVERNDGTKAEVQFRSLFEPRKLRGRELAAFHIDEGRNVTREAWNRLFDRMRQPGYNRAGFVTSTPNGFDWMYDLFHEKSKNRGKHADGSYFQWYNAPTDENEVNLPPEYVAELKANLSGLMLQQEFYGQFVGVTQGAVFPGWDPLSEITNPILEYDPDLPLYSLWDFGIGDPGVVLWVQVGTEQVFVDGIPVWIRNVRVLDYREEKDWGAKQWADYFHEHVYENYGRKVTDGNYGDPAGKQRSHASGTSVIDDLTAAGVPIIPATKRPADYGIRIVGNLIDGGRLFVNGATSERVSQALAAARWPLDKSGNKTGREPVHDWTSHFLAALRYGAAGFLNFFPTRGERPADAPPPPGSAGAVMDHFLRTAGGSRWLNGGEFQRPAWQTPHPLGRINA